jgi:hypothetical protein
MRGHGQEEPHREQATGGIFASGAIATAKAGST